MHFKAAEYVEKDIYNILYYAVCKCTGKGESNCP